ncbi:MAG: methionine adenosyltransferase [Candidatus Micrarchaeota archaeon]
MRNIYVESSKDEPIERKPFEIVERKGIGHPDTMIDGIVESFSVNLCRDYLKEIGKIMHHNVDKGQICGGSTIVDYGGGKFIKPIHVLLSGRATDTVNGTRIPVEAIGIKSIKEFLTIHCRNLDVAQDVTVDSYVSAGSKDLVDVFLRAPEIPLANDTSFGVGFAPLSETERVVIAVEKMLNSLEYKKKCPVVGEDIKVMGLRERDEMILTICIAFVSKYVSGLEQYKELKERITDDVVAEAQNHTKYMVSVSINTGDDYERESVYLTLTGLSCEMGDDGSVGRGNRPNGLITPCRPMTMEAAAGKNPVNHVGKIYSVMAFEIANDVVAKHEYVNECEINLLSQIGMPIDQPKSANIKVITKNGNLDSGCKKEIENTVDWWLANVTNTTERIVDGKSSVYY